MITLRVFWLLLLLPTLTFAQEKPTLKELELHLEIVKLKRYAAQSNLERAVLLEENSRIILREVQEEEKKIRAKMDELRKGQN